MTRLRVVTLNLWGTEPPLDRRLALAGRQLAALAPDVVCLQEVRPLDGRDGRTTADVLADALGMTAIYEVSLRWDDDALRVGMAAGQEGLAILSRHPVLEHRALPLPEARPTEARLLLSARLDTPAGPIWVHTTHLHYRLDDGLAREHQVVAVDDAIRALGRGNTDAPQILCGDLNATPDADEVRFLRGLCTLAGRRTHWQDAWLRLHPEPGPGDGPAQGITWSSDNEQTRPLRSLDIDRRIDYVLVTSRKKDGRGTVHRCEVVLTDRDGEGADEVCASDHYGVLAEIQIGVG
ncbi:MAG: endonuclease/exonuclease/phosphatase family protein [Kofleriaceae bacterium]|nr:endonuclease/exonuclease/phosphatase family protein [Myxococcales bacterium]MCB9563694.1 endonuclease/exonuclease/phosphatase family protein [Kofleriaceae bacterium]MCB9571147.1 endonuclease/exonuclease/phosphatase family protein [Kofleriaceae bacterium]